MKNKTEERNLSWETIEQSPADSFKIFDVARRKSKHPETGELHNFVVIDSPNWVNMVALKPNDEVVLVRQFRHGIEDVTLEIPGGIVDPGETPLDAAKRELLEETGYASEQWFELGVVEPNPAFQTNRCWTYLALDVYEGEALPFDSSEVIQVEYAPLKEIPTMIGNGEILHSLVVSGFFHLIRRAGGWQRPSLENLKD